MSENQGFGGWGEGTLMVGNICQRTRDLEFGGRALMVGNMCQENQGFGGGDIDGREHMSENQGFGGWRKGIDGR